MEEKVGRSKMDLRWQRVLYGKMLMAFRFQTHNSSPGGDRKANQNPETISQFKRDFFSLPFHCHAKEGVPFLQEPQWIILSRWVFVMLQSPTSWKGDAVDWNGFSELNVTGCTVWKEKKSLVCGADCSKKFRLKGPKKNNNVSASLLKTLCSLGHS